MRFLKAFLYCLLGFVLAFLLMFLIKYKEYKSYTDIPTITLNVGSGDVSNNSLPTLENLALSFPGYSEIYDCSDHSNTVTVKVTAVNATDEDGMVSRLIFYYYDVDDPSRILEYKESLVYTPYAYFVVPKNGHEYRFGVTLYDNNGGVVDSDDIIGKGPTFYSPSCGDAPIVTLRLSNYDIEVGDTVTYTVISRIPFDSGDFEKNRQIYYDFTGDGKRDLVTGSNIVDYTFTEPFIYGAFPRAAVEYRGKLGIGDGAKIFVGKYDYTGEWM